MEIQNKNNKEIAKNKFLELLPNFREKTTQKFTTIILTLIALSFFGLFAINPTLSTIAKLQKELEDNQFVDNSLRQKISNLSILQQKYSVLQNDIPIILNTIPQDSQIPLIMGEIQSIVKQSNIQLESLQNFQVELVKNNDTNNRYYSFEFSVSGFGSYDSISKFINSLTNMQRLINIEVFSVNRQTDNNTSLRFTLRGMAFYKK